MSYLRNAGQKAGNILIATFVLVAMAACSATYRNHGYMPLPEAVDALQVGVDTRETVTASIGKPGTAGLLAESGYYYVRSRFKHFTYNAPEEIDRQVLAVTFSEGGVLENVERFGLEDGQIVVLERRVTDSNVKGVTFIRQLLGSFGRIDVAEQIGGGG